METKRLLKLVAAVLVICFVLGVTALGAILLDIHWSVQKYCAAAQKAHPSQSDVDALIEFMNSDTHTFRERNLAVWTLGRLSDPKALPALTAVYTGGPCEHSKKLCQYELEKAIKRCGGTPEPVLK